MIKRAWVPLALIFVSSVAEFLGGGADLWQYDREGILGGQVWRLLTGHLVHGTQWHWLLNMAGLLLIWAVYPGYFRQISALFATLGIMLLISAALLVLNPDVTWYLGMSALLHGLFAAWSLADFLGGRRIALLPLALVVLKVLYEQYAGASPEVVAAIGLPVLVDAHLYGVIAGLGLGGVGYKLGWLVTSDP
ncbi:MAG: rhombosortase [Gammaproteobacteria bacterium]|nr:rhombosortase [Gammaproteobacteria bacterium]